MKKNVFFLLILLFSTLCVYSQEDENTDEVDPCVQTMDKKIEKEYKKARSLQKDGKKNEAISIYNELIDIDPNLLEVNYYLGLSYYFSIERDNFMMDHHKTDAETALAAFNRINDVCPYFKIIHNILAARIAFANKQYADAVKFSKIIIENPDMVKNLEDIENAEHIYKTASFYNKIFNSPVPFSPTAVEGICTKEDEFLATISPDGAQFYFTRRVEENVSNAFGSETQSIEYFCMSPLNTSGHFMKGNPLPDPFNTSTKEGSPTINLTNDLLIFSRLLKGNINGQSYPNYDLFYSEFIDGEWSTPQSLGENVNRGNSWESNPSLSSNGKLLLFASDRIDGGYGGSDLWFTTRNSDGTWRKPQNLGPHINTKGNERSPFLHTDSKTLYFSSDGHPGIGGMDIFYSRLDENDNWTPPQNIGYPINTENNDVDFFVSFDGKTAYFSSNGISDDWNIYQFELYEEARPRNMMMIKGVVKTQEEDLSNVVVEIRDTSLNVIAQAKVNENTGNYAIVTEVDKYNPQPIIVNVKKEGYAFDTHLILPDPHQNKIIQTDAAIKKVEKGGSYDLHDIYFGTNLYTLTTESKYLIDLFAEFLQENPNITVEIQGHTDNIGDPKANQILSEKRAQSVYNYLISKHISNERIQFKGYGASDPIASNESESGRAKNRRTVFVITNM